MTRWKAIGLLVVSIALLATSCPGDAEEDKARADDELIRQSLEDAAAAEDEASAATGDPAVPEDVAVASDDALVPEDDAVSSDEADCVVPPNGPDPQVVVNVVIPAINDQGNLHFNVRMCEPVDPQNPFGHLHSGFFLCPPWFGFEIHTEVRAVLGEAKVAKTLADGSFWFDTGAPPPDPLPVEVDCDHASWPEATDPVTSGFASVLFRRPPATGNELVIFVEPVLVLTEDE